MKSANYILTGKAIFDGLHDEPKEGFVAISNNKILACGFKDEGNNDYSHLLNNQTKIIDFDEQLIIPGLHDAHIHFYMSALYNSPFIHVSFTDTSEQQCVDGLAAFADKVPKDKWLIGAGWYHPIWDVPKLPTKRSLDKVFPDRPVCMVSGDGHTMWLNSEGLRKLGLRDDSVPPKGGYYDRFENGELNGIIREAAATKLSRKVYNFTEEEENNFYLEFVNKLNSYGITSICDMSMMALPGADFIRDDIYQRLLEQDLLTVRANLFPTLRMDLSRPRELAEKYQGDLLRCQGTKQFFDGVSSTHTAFLKEPYSNATSLEDRGVPTIPPEEMRELVLNAHKNDFSVRIHAIGDQSIHLLIDYFEEAEQIYGYKPYLQHTIEHLENFQPEDIKRLSKVHVVASVQPAHLAIDPNGIERDLGLWRIHYMWPFRSLLDAGVTLAFGTDSPVVDINPFYNIYNAVTRQSAFTQEPKGGWIPEEKISLQEALKAYTYGSSCAANRKDEVGQLKPGMLADIAVLDHNLFNEKPEALLETEVLLTFMNGKIVYQK